MQGQTYMMKSTETEEYEQLLNRLFVDKKVKVKLRTAFERSSLKGVIPAFYPSTSSVVGTTQ